MKKRYQMENLDCANCAAKMEQAIQKIEGITAASVSFMTQKLTIEAEENQFEQIMDRVIAVCKKVEPDCKIKR